MTAYPIAPASDALLDATRLSPEILAFLNSRRSTAAPLLGDPGPPRQELLQILHLAVRVPDHRCLAPWRFIIVEGAARKSAGAIFAKRYAALHDDATIDDLDREHRRFSYAPVVVAVISSPDITHKTPVWEQELSAGAVCYNLLLASNAAGWAGSWLTQWIAFDAHIANAFGLTGQERVAGFVHLGTATEKLPERSRPAIEPLVTYWQAR